MTPGEMAFFLMGIRENKNENGVIVRTIDGAQMYDDKDCYFWLIEEGTHEQEAEKESI